MQIGLERLDFVGRQNEDRTIGARDHRPVVRGVQGDEILDRHLGQAGGHLDIDVARLDNRAEVGGVGHVRQAHRKQFGTHDNVLDRLQLGHIAGGLGRHAQTGVVGRLTLGTRLLDRARDRAFAPVVRCQRELPVAEHGVERLQVVERGGGRGKDVAAVVAPPVLLQIEALAGRRNELPHAGGLGRRNRARVVG